MPWPALVVALALVTLISGPPAQAGAHDRARSAVQAGEAQPLGAILPGIEQRYPGRALSADIAEQGGNLIYRIKWLGNDGKVRDITVDARNGRIVNVR